MTVVAADARRMADDPARYFHGIGYEAQHMPRDEIAALQLSGLQQRFADLRNRLPVLQAMADEQRIGAIGELDEVVPLLFPHTIYKSYPTSLLDGDRYDRLTFFVDQPDPGHPELAVLHGHRADLLKQLSRVSGINDGLVDMTDGSIQPARFQ